MSSSGCEEMIPNVVVFKTVAWSISKATLVILIKRAMSSCDIDDNCCV